MSNSVQSTELFPADNLLSRIAAYAFTDNLTVQKLVRLIAMSRTDLHRKLTNTVGMSATEYVRRIRLFKASVLLLERPDLSIYQVALEVGFNSQSYFTKRFREIFGENPTSWRKRSLEHL